MADVKSAQTSGRERSRLQRLALLAFALASVAAAVSGYLIHLQDLHEEQAQAALIRSYDARAQIRIVLGLLIDAETGERGFILTGSDNFLEPYRRMQKELPGALQALDSMLSSDAEQHSRAIQLHSLNDRLLAHLAGIIRARQRGPLTAENTLVLSRRGKQLMDSIRAVAADMVAGEQADVDAAHAAEMQHRQRMHRLVFGMLASVVLMMLIATVLIVLHLERRRRLEHELRRRERHVRGQRKIAETINQARDFHDALDQIVPQLMELLSLSRGRSFVVDWGRAGAQVRAGAPWPQNTTVEFLPESQLIEAAQAEAGFEPLTKEGDSPLVVPIMDQGRPIAGLELYDQSDPAESREIADYAGQQLTLAAERQRILDSLNEVLARHKAIFDSATDAILTLNESGTIESFNPAAERMFGYSTAEILRRHITTVLPYGADDAHAAMSEIREAREGLGRVQETVARRRDASSFPVDVAMSQMHLGERVLLVAVLRDATERKRLEKLKNEFVSTVSHELRTPLTSISGSLGLLAGGAAGALSPAASRLVGIAHQNCDRLVRLINDVLDIQKIESGTATFRMQEVHIPAIVQNVLDSNQAYAANFNVQLRLQGKVPEVVVQADPDRLTQVLTNLVSNAVKFSPAESEVSLAAVAERGRVRLSVRDRGPGIAEEFRSRIFSKFAQADSADTRQKAGTGLGLAIVREIVDRLGGKVWYDTALGAGTVFYVELPTIASVGAQTAKPVSTTRPAPQTTAREEPTLEREDSILLCEGTNRAVGHVLAQLLARVGLRTDAVSSSGEAIERINNQSYAAIVIILGTRQCGSLDLIRVVREREHSHRTPVLMVGTEFDPATRTLRTDALELVDWLDAPTQQDALIGRLRQMLRTEGIARPTVLHVDDDPDILAVVRESLAEIADVSSVSTMAAALEALREHDPDLVVLDLRLAEGSGLDLLPVLKDSRGRPLPTIIFSAQSADEALLARVDAALTKSQTGSLDRLGQEVLRLAKRRRAGFGRANGGDDEQEAPALRG